MANLGAMLSIDAKLLALLDYLDKKNSIEQVELMLNGPEFALAELMKTPFGNKMNHIESKLNELIKKLDSLMS